MMSSLRKERGDESFEWKIKLKDFKYKEYPLRYFEFEFADSTSKHQYSKYFWPNMYPNVSTPKEMHHMKLATKDIRKGNQAVIYLKMRKGEQVKYEFTTVYIQENYEDRSVDSRIKCIGHGTQKTIFIPPDCLIDPTYSQMIELSGLEKFAFMTEFKKLISIEDDLTAILTVKSPIWKGTHCSAVLFKGKSDISLNEKLENAMNYFLKYRQQMMAPGILGISTTLSISTEIESWIFEARQPTLYFHVSEIIEEGMSPSLIIHPVKYWKLFKQMELDLQEYGKQLPELGRNFEERGSFLIAARESKDPEGNRIFKLYRGWHTGKISFQGGTHKIAMLDYAAYLWVENGNMMPLIPTFCTLPMMGAKCLPRFDGKIPEDSLPLKEFYQQHCVGDVQNWNRPALFPVVEINNIKPIPHHRFITTFEPHK